MGKSWNPVQGGHDNRSIMHPGHPRPRSPPFSLFKTVEVLESQAAVLRKTVAECPKPHVHRLVHSGVLFLRSGLSGCH